MPLFTSTTPDLACPSCKAGMLVTDDVFRTAWAADGPGLGAPVLRAECPEGHRFRVRYVAEPACCGTCGDTLPLDGVVAHDPLEVDAQVECDGCEARTRVHLRPVASVAPPAAWTRAEARGIVDAHAAGGSVRGFVTGQVTAGLRVAFGGRVAGVLPTPLADLSARPDLAELVGRSVELRVVRYDLAWCELVVDRRSILAEGRAAARQRLLAALRVGDVLDGVVRGVAEYGAFVDLGGVDALLHVTEMGGERVMPGERLRVAVTRLDVAAESVGVRRA